VKHLSTSRSVITSYQACSWGSHKGTKKYAPLSQACLSCHDSQSVKDTRPLRFYYNQHSNMLRKGCMLLRVTCSNLARAGPLQPEIYTSTPSQRPTSLTMQLACRCHLCSLEGQVNDQTPRFGWPSSYLAKSSLHISKERAEVRVGDSDVLRMKGDHTG
jgi:hypothetical protein